MTTPTLPDRLHAYRARKGMAQPELASAWGISLRTLQGWESGRSAGNAEGPILALLAEMDMTLWRVAQALYDAEPTDHCGRSFDDLLESERLDYEVMARAAIDAIEAWHRSDTPSIAAASVAEALALQRPLPDGALRVVARGTKEDIA